MIRTENILRVDIAEVVEVIVEPVKTSEEIMEAERKITVRTLAGETVVLYLSAREPDELEFQEKDEADWLKPKLYKRKS